MTRQQRARRRRAVQSARDARKRTGRKIYRRGHVPRPVKLGLPLRVYQVAYGDYTFHSEF